MTGYHRAVVRPPAGEGEGAGDKLAVGGVIVNIEGKSERRPDLRFHPQQGQYAGVCRRLIAPLLG